MSSNRRLAKDKKLDRYTRHPFHPKIKWLQLIPDISLCVISPLARPARSRKGTTNDPRHQSTWRPIVPRGDLAEGYNVVLVAIGEVDSEANDLV